MDWIIRSAGFSLVMIDVYHVHRVVSLSSPPSLGIFRGVKFRHFIISDFPSFVSRPPQLSEAFSLYFRSILYPPSFISLSSVSLLCVYLGFFKFLMCGLFLYKNEWPPSRWFLQELCRKLELSLWRSALYNTLSCQNLKPYDEDQVFHVIIFSWF